MTRKDWIGALTLAAVIVVFVLSLSTHVFDVLVVPLASVALVVIVTLAVVAAFVYSRKYVEDHPYIPYAGKLSHIWCRTCFAQGRDHTVELVVGTASEHWSKEGRYSRTFRREFQAMCDLGHAWRFDPIFNRNEGGKRRSMFPKARGYEPQTKAEWQTFRKMLRRAWGVTEPVEAE